MEYIKYLLKRSVNDYEFIDLTYDTYKTTLDQTDGIFQSVPSSIRLRTGKTNRVFIKLDDTDFSDYVLLEILKYLMQLPDGYTVIVTCNTAPLSTLLCMFAREIILCGDYHGSDTNLHLFQYAKELYQNFYERVITFTTQFSELGIARQITLIEKTIFNVQNGNNNAARTVTKDISDILKNNNKPFEIQLAELEKPEVLKNRLKLAIDKFRAREKVKMKIHKKINQDQNADGSTDSTDGSTDGPDDLSKSEQPKCKNDFQQDTGENNTVKENPSLSTIETTETTDNDDRRQFQLEIHSDYKDV